MKTLFLTVLLLCGLACSVNKAKAVTVEGPTWSYNHATAIYGFDYFWDQDWFWDEESNQYEWVYGWVWEWNYRGVIAYGDYLTRVPDSVQDDIYKITITFNDSTSHSYIRIGNGGNIDINLTNIRYGDTTGDGNIDPIPVSASAEIIGPEAGDPVAGSPSVLDGALDAAIDGGTRYSTHFLKSVLTVVDPQSYADGLGAIAGFVINAVDSGTRAQVAQDIYDSVSSLSVAQNWEDAAEYFTTPEGLADITSSLAVTVVTAGTGDIEIPTNISGISGSISKTRIGATGAAGEKALADLFGDPGTVASRTNWTPDGYRVADNIADDVSRESKVGYASLTKSIQRQVDKDVWLRENTTFASVEWWFWDSEATQTGGPSNPLKAYLDANGIPCYYNGELLPPGPFQ